MHVHRSNEGGRYEAHMYEIAIPGKAWGQGKSIAAVQHAMIWAQEKGVRGPSRGQQNSPAAHLTRLAQLHVEVSLHICSK